MLALTPRIGYTSNVDMVSIQPFVKLHPCRGYLCNGTLTTSFNRFLYPANHLLESKASTTFTRISEPYDYSGRSVEESLIIEALLSEFPINIPLFFVIGCIIAVGLDRSIQRVRSMRK